VAIIASLALTFVIIIVRISCADPDGIELIWLSQVIMWAAWIRKDYPGFITVPVLLVNLVSVAVAFIPEGLPVCVTLSLSRIASSLAKEQVLCKSLATVETLGGS
jgi:sodium/potassium-transporting ATPase subunit alpha